MPDNLLHEEDYEKEAKFHELLAANPGLKAAVLHSIIEAVNPGFLSGLFERRQCQRKLLYVGNVKCGGPEFDSEEDELKIGKVYESEDFNGGTYTIKGRGILRGYAYFERVT